MSLCNKCQPAPLETHTHYKRLLKGMQETIEQLYEHEKEHEKSETTSKEKIDLLEATIRQLQEALSETQPERRTELVHDMTRLSAEFLQSSDLAALAETSKAGKRVVTSLGPSQPYLQKCAAPSVFGDPPIGLPRFDEGCKHLWKNILGLFSAVIVMAKKFNDGEDVINMVKFDIQDHTDNPKTIFKYIPSDTEIPFQAFTWDTVEKKFSVMKAPRRGHPPTGPVYLNEEEELVKAIQEHWAVRLPPPSHMVTQDSNDKNAFWAPVIEFWFQVPDPRFLRQMDKKMATALNEAGRLALSYRFVTNHTSTSRYALFHHSIMEKSAKALLPATPWQRTYPTN